MIAQKMSEVFVDKYSATDPIEHFAQAFAYYYIMPEHLKKKEKEIYDHFNGFFGKYEG
jgi:Mlc titration factor MtfA (ptsG expression regulator)